MLRAHTSATTRDEPTVRVKKLSQGIDVLVVDVLDPLLGEVTCFFLSYYHGD